MHVNAWEPRCCAVQLAARKKLEKYLDLVVRVAG